MIQKLLSEIEGYNIEIACDAVCYIQCLDISEHKEQVVKSLLNFIDRHHDTTNDEIQIAVGAAVRKVVLNSDKSNFNETVLRLLRYDDKDGVICLETCKCIINMGLELDNNACYLLESKLDGYINNTDVNGQRYVAILNMTLVLMLNNYQEKWGTATKSINDEYISSMRKVLPEWLNKLVDNRLKRLKK